MTKQDMQYRIEELEREKAELVRALTRILEATNQCDPSPHYALGACQGYAQSALRFVGVEVAA